MEDKQLDYVISKIRESEEKTEQLTTVLEGFHQTFDRLIGNVEKVLQSGTIDQATKSVRQLDTHLGRIEKQMGINQGELTGALEQVVEIVGSVKEVGQTPSRQATQSLKSVYSDGAFYIVDETRLSLLKYDLKSQKSRIIVTMDSEIQSLGMGDGKIYLYSDQEKLYEVDGELKVLLEDVVDYKMTNYGILYKNKLGNLKLYKYDGIQKSIAKRVEYFEVLGEEHLLFQGNKTELQLLNLETLDVEHPITISL